MVINIGSTEDIRRHNVTIRRRNVTIKTTISNYIDDVM